MWGSVGEIQKFWLQMVDHPAYEHHHVRLRGDFRDRCIPLALHGDGVAVTGISKKWAKSCDAFSWRSVLSRGSTITTNFLIWLMFWSAIVRHPAMDMWERCVKKLCWSFYWLFICKFPDRDVNKKSVSLSLTRARRQGTVLQGVLRMPMDLAGGPGVSGEILETGEPWLFASL